MIDDRHIVLGKRNLEEDVVQILLLARNFDFMRGLCSLLSTPQRIHNVRSGRMYAAFRVIYTQEIVHFHAVDHYIALRDIDCGF